MDYSNEGNSSSEVLDAMKMDVDSEPSQPQSQSQAHPRLGSPTPPDLAMTSSTMRARSVPAGSLPDRVGYVYSAEMSQHFCPRGHPECPDRLLHIWDALRGAQLHTQMRCLPIRQVKREEAMLVHSEDHWNKVESIQYLTEDQIADSEDYYEQLSLYVMSGTTRSARLSCGGVIEATLAVARGELQKSFAIVRPPGHHAEPDEHMGFCFFNNVAVAARVVQQVTKVKKILILDWDIHHGNGTQRAFNDDPSILYMSLHRYDNGTFYPCGPFGCLDSCGEGPGLGFSVNIPWPSAGMGDADYLLAFQKIIMPIAMEFAPELVIISAGFDAAAGDELGQCFVSPAGYAHMTYMLSGLARGKLVVALEGGYNLDSISQSALAVTRVILGEPPEELPPMIATDTATETVWMVAKEQSKYWKSVDPMSCEPTREDVDSLAFSLPEVLKAHRQHYLYTHYDMLAVPFPPPLEARFSQQVSVSNDVMTNDTLVCFIHQSGNIRAELDASARCDLEVEKSYLIDYSKQLIDWAHDEKFSILDINSFPKPVVEPTANGRPKGQEGSARELITYLWDNFVSISNARRIVVISHGPGSQLLMELINERSTTVMRTVKAVVQIVGLSRSPAVPKYADDVRSWYTKHSLVVLPSSHAIVDARSKKVFSKHGSITTFDETQPAKLMIRAFPTIKDFVREALQRSPLNNATSRLNNSAR
ncbi:Histone deacetylase hda1 [Pleurotus pulmonarius]|nr:Histone deacetylase hda1 [Pleurotus pulmonarius]KAF4598552.1 Histone deacetylase hda1 [Pleurotus pulmonarius]